MLLLNNPTVSVEASGKSKGGKGERATGRKTSRIEDRRWQSVPETQEILYPQTVFLSSPFLGLGQRKAYTPLNTALAHGFTRRLDRFVTGKDLLDPRDLNDHAHRRGERRKHHLSFEALQLTVEREDCAQARRVQDSCVGEVDNEVPGSEADLVEAHCFEGPCIGKVEHLIEMHDYSRLVWFYSDAHGAVSRLGGFGGLLKFRPPSPRLNGLAVEGYLFDGRSWIVFFKPSVLLIRADVATRCHRMGGWKDFEDR